MAKKKNSETLPPAAVLRDTLKKQFKDAALYLGSELPDISGYHQTGSLDLDIKLAGRGIPRGRITQVQGKDGSGKTSLLHHTCAKLQATQEDASILWVAAEPYEKEWAAQNGVEVDRITILPPFEAEDSLDIAIYSIENNLVDLVVVDSVAALCPKSIDDKDVGDKVIAGPAGVISRFCVKTGPAFNRAQFKYKEGRAAVVVINQVRDRFTSGPGGMAAEPEAKGGWALRHHKTIDLKFTRGEFIWKTVSGEKKVIGSNIKVRLVKVKMTGAEFWGSAGYDYYVKDWEPAGLDAGSIDTAKDVRELGSICGVLTYQRGGSFYIPSHDHTIKGEDVRDANNRMDMYLRYNPDICSELEQLIREAMTKDV